MDQWSPEAEDAGNHLLHAGSHEPQFPDVRRVAREERGQKAKPFSSLKNIFVEFEIEIILILILGLLLRDVIRSFFVDIFFPLTSSLLGVKKISHKCVVLRGGNVLLYGEFLQSLVSFLFVSLVIYGLVNLYERKALGGARPAL